MASAALICAWVPDSVSVPLPLAPAEIVAPPARLTLTVPLATESCVVERLPSTSFTLMPETDSAVFQTVVCAPGTVLTGASATAATVIATVSESVRPLLSVLVTVSVSAPLKFALPWYEIVANAALICAWVPDSVSVPLPLAPAEMVAPPARLTLTVPLATESCVVERLPSTSFTLTPVMLSGASSFTVCAPGTVLSGLTLKLMSWRLTCCTSGLAVWPDW